MVTLLDNDMLDIDGKVFQTSEPGQDASRNILIHDGIVYKIGCSDPDLAQDAEWLIWSVLSEQDKKYFAPVIDHGNNWVAMQYVDFVDAFDLPENEAERVYNKIVAPLARKYGIIDIDYGKNWGLRRDGTPVIYDYGIVEWQYKKLYMNSVMK